MPDQAGEGKLFLRLIQHESSFSCSTINIYFLPSSQIRLSQAWSDKLGQLLISCDWTHSTFARWQIKFNYFLFLFRDNFLQVGHFFRFVLSFDPQSPSFKNSITLISTLWNDDDKSLLRLLTVIPCVVRSRTWSSSLRDRTPPRSPRRSWRVSPSLLLSSHWASWSPSRGPHPSPPPPPPSPPPESWPSVCPARSAWKYFWFWCLIRERQRVDTLWRKPRLF